MQFFCATSVCRGVERGVYLCTDGIGLVLIIVRLSDWFVGFIIGLLHRCVYFWNYESFCNIKWETKTAKASIFCVKIYQMPSRESLGDTVDPGWGRRSMEELAEAPGQQGWGPRSGHHPGKMRCFFRLSLGLLGERAARGHPRMDPPKAGNPQPKGGWGGASTPCWGVMSTACWNFYRRSPTKVITRAPKCTWKKKKGKDLNTHQAQRNSVLNFCQSQRKPTNTRWPGKHISSVPGSPASSTSILEDPGQPSLGEEGKGEHWQMKLIK